MESHFGVRWPRVVAERRHQATADTMIGKQNEMLQLNSPPVREADAVAVYGEGFPSEPESIVIGGGLNRMKLSPPNGHELGNAIRFAIPNSVQPWPSSLESFRLPGTLLLHGIETGGDNPGSLRVGIDTARFNEQFERSKRSVGKGGLRKNRLHRLRVKENVGCGLGSGHVQSLHNEYVSGSIEAG